MTAKESPTLKPSGSKVKTEVNVDLIMAKGGLVEKACFGKITIIVKKCGGK